MAISRSLIHRLQSFLSGSAPQSDPLPLASFMMPAAQVSAVQARHSEPLSTETKVILAMAIILSIATSVLTVLLCIFRSRLLDLTRLVEHVDQNVDQLKGRGAERMKLFKSIEQKVEALAEENRKREFSARKPPVPDARYESIEELDPGSVTKITIPRKKVGSKTKWPEAKRMKRRPVNANASAPESTSPLETGAAGEHRVPRADNLPEANKPRNKELSNVQAPKPSSQDEKLLRPRSRTFPLLDDTSDVQSNAWSENSSSLLQHPVNLRAGPGAVVNVKQQDGDGDVGKDDYRIAVIETMP